LDDTDTALLEDDRVVVPLVPRLVEGALGTLGRDVGMGLVEPHRVRVVVLGLSHVRHTNVGVAQPHDSHCNYSLEVVALARSACARARASARCRALSL